MNDLTEVLVIGAGPAGIAAAYHLQQAGLPYRVIDRAGVLASTWASLYPSLRLNTSRFFSHLPGRKFPLHYGIFPTGLQYQRYVARYAQDYDLNIQLGMTVRRVCPEDGGWRVDTDAGSSWHRAIICATGRFGAPCWPDIPGQELFGGTLIHAHDYRGSEPFIGKQVMVVGNGPSGIDIAVELGTQAARPVLLSQRTGVVLRPRYPWGLPKHLWMMLGDLLPDAIARPLLDHLLEKRFENLDQIGLKVPGTPEETSAAGAARGAELIAAVRAGRVRSVDGPARFTPTGVTLTDGSTLALDAVILATGYRPVIHQYIDLRHVPVDRDGWPLRVGEDPADVSSGGRQVLDQPGLYLVGTFYQGKGAMYNFGEESAAAVQEIAAYLAE